MIQSVSNSRTGNGTMYIGSRLRGRILALKIVAGAVTDNYDMVLTGETTEMPIFTHANLTLSTTEWYFPRRLASDHADESTSADCYVEIPVLNERIKCVISAAGTDEDVTVTVFYDSEE
jgi:hypothetical protein